VNAPLLLLALAKGQTHLPHPRAKLHLGNLSGCDWLVRAFMRHAVNVSKDGTSIDNFMRELATSAVSR
jgi:hypothetical protein